MPRCKCGFVLPEGCPLCPPHVINCPNCGAECLIEPMAQEQMDAVLREYRSRKR